MHLDSCVGSLCAAGTCRHHQDAHSPRLARLKGVMVVWWTKHQLGKKTPRDSPKHSPQDAPRLVCGESVRGRHMSPPSRRPLATSGTFERCHDRVVDQAPTW